MQPDKGLIFSVQTMQTTIGGSLKAVYPDDDGVYRDVPLAIIGKPSRNNAMYDPRSFVASITNPATRFYKSLSEGGLYGEWEHPSSVGLCEEDSVRRAMEIRRESTSHYFTRIYSKPSADKAYLVVYGDVVPCGAKGKYLTEAFADPKRNASFSLRSLTAKTSPNAQGITNKKIIALITFDTVSTGGFEEASKRFMQTSNEDLDFCIYDESIATGSTETVAAALDSCDLIGLESVNSQCLLDMLESDDIKISIKEEDVVGKLSSTGGLITSAGRTSAFHSLFN